MDDAEAYGTFNMGAGFVFYLPGGRGPAGAGASPPGGASTLLTPGRSKPGPRRVVLAPPRRHLRERQPAAALTRWGRACPARGASGGHVMRPGPACIVVERERRERDGDA